MAWGEKWTDYLTAVVNPIGSTAAIYSDVSEQVAAGREAQAEAKAAKAEADARARAAAAEAKAAEAEAGARAAEAERAAADSRSRTTRGSSRSSGASTTIRSPEGVTLTQRPGASSMSGVYIGAAAIAIVGGIYYYTKKRR